MKLYIIQFLLSVVTSNLFAQNRVCYGYDAFGNRTTRTIMLSESMADASRTKQKTYVDGSEKYNITIHPDCADSHVNVIVSNDIGTKISGLIIVYDTGGAVVVKQKISETGNDVNLNRVQNGMYILHINVGNEVFTWKIIKGH